MYDKQLIIMIIIRYIDIPLYHQLLDMVII